MQKNVRWNVEKPSLSRKKEREKRVVNVCTVCKFIISVISCKFRHTQLTS